METKKKGQVVIVALGILAVLMLVIAAVNNFGGSRGAAQGEKTWQEAVDKQLQQEAYSGKKEFDEEEVEALEAQVYEMVKNGKISEEVAAAKMTAIRGGVAKNQGGYGQKK